MINRPSTRRSFSAPKRWSQPTLASNMSSGYLPSLEKFAKLRDCDAPSRSAQRQAELWARCCARGVAEPRQDALSDRGRSASSGPRGDAFAVEGHTAFFKVQKPPISCTPHLVRARQTTPTSKGRVGDHAVGRRPWSPRSGSPVLGPAPSSRELPVAKCDCAQLERILQGRAPMKIGQ